MVGCPRETGRAYGKGLGGHHLRQHAVADQQVVDAVAGVVVRSVGPGVSERIGRPQVMEQGLALVGPDFPQGGGVGRVVQVAHYQQVDVGIFLKGIPDVIAQEAGLVAAFGL